MQFTMHGAILLLHCITLVTAGAETSCDAADSSCLAGSPQPPQKALLQHRMANKNSNVEEDQVESQMNTGCKGFCTTDKCNWKHCKTCNFCPGNENAAPDPIEEEPTGPTKNVLLIMTDDFNVDIGAYGHSQSLTPNIDKLAAMGTRFDFAFAQHPVCVPSRASFLTGLYGTNTLAMYKEKYWKYDANKHSRTFVEQFMEGGYKTYGTGKIGHKEKPKMFDVWGRDPDYGPIWANENLESAAHPALKENYVSMAIDVSFGRLSTAAPYINGNAGWKYLIQTTQALEPIRYVNDDDRDLTPDELNADWTVEKLGDPDLKTHFWFLACGLVRPHTPLYALDKHFDKFPLESITLPEILDDDASDVNFPLGMGGKQYQYLVDAYGRDEGLKLHLQAYLASINFVDDQVGKIYDALEANGYLGNTIVVLTSDHGWHEGQKDVLWKNTPWEEATRVPLIIADPTMDAGQVVKFPVGLIDVYPTLIDLCGLPKKTTLDDKGQDLDGVSLLPLLEDPSSELAREGVVSMISNYGATWNYEKCNSCKNKDDVKGNPFNHHMAVRTKDWRYIWVGDGTEELYDHKADPHEWNNLIGKGPTGDLTPDLKEVRSKLRDILNKELVKTGKSIGLDADPTSVIPKPQWR